ncbi:winged helix-turn-helix transcriptional regulator [Salipiger pacificus]|nr:winged helix-turn-helix transcriptional regulator [Alloyangia pacifica]MCA0943887.1 winged helix-turn-helix transcriptional regulator [Alloyangia pacifica]
MPDLDRSACLGPDGAVAQVTRCLKMISGRWKLPILFRLYADGLIRRTDFGEKPPRVEYRLTDRGAALMPVLLAARQFAEDHEQASE